MRTLSLGPRGPGGTLKRREGKGKAKNDYLFER